MYIHELKDWPRFRWDAEKLAEPLASVRHRSSAIWKRWDSTSGRKLFFRL